ncbi:MAG TPA: hemolysin family protein [Candidatus Sumerlaeota bacterium]|nr:hemolysin family protein [Candidatus Sumerlaeota bacterium]
MVGIFSVALISSLISFFSSLMEAALYAVPTSRIQAMVDQGVTGAKSLLRLRERIDEAISAILTFNTIANTVGGAIFGALAGKEYGAESATTYILMAVFTLWILIFSEIIPKTVGVTFADVLAPKLAFLMNFLIFALYPFVKASQYLTARIRSAGAERKAITEEDLISQAKLAAAEGTIQPEEAVWLTNALRLNDKTVHDLMTPRTVVYLLPAELPLSMVSAHSEHWKHSRLPLCRNRQPDEVVGIVYRREVFDALASKEDDELKTITLESLMHPVEYVPETLTVNQALQRLVKGREHFFVVTNEHGGLEGVITLEDVIEDLLGVEIVDAHDQHVDMQEYARRLAERRRAGPSARTPQQPEAPTHDATGA